MTAAAGTLNPEDAPPILAGESAAPTTIDSSTETGSWGWWYFEATSSGTMHANVAVTGGGSPYMEVYYGPGPGATFEELTLISSDAVSTMSFPVGPGGIYYIYVGPAISEPAYSAILSMELAESLPAAYLYFSKGIQHQIPPAELTLTPLVPIYTRYTPRTVRWRFTDPSNGDFWDFTINPDQMTSPTKEKDVRHTLGVGANYGRFGTIETAAKPREWTFGGVIRSKAQHDTMESWYERTGVIHVTDHLSRTFEVVLQGFEVEERKPTKTVTWRLRYTMKTLLLRQLS